MFRIQTRGHMMIVADESSGQWRPSRYQLIFKLEFLFNQQGLIVNVYFIYLRSQYHVAQFMQTTPYGSVTRWLDYFY